MRRIKDPASALGEAIGRLVEEAVREAVANIIKPYGLKISDKKKISDKVNIAFEIDIPILKDKDLIALIDVKYLRYKKHARDKGSWVVVAHNRLKASYPTIKRTLVILLGYGWTEEAKRLISTSCIDVIDLEPTLLDTILSRFGIRFAWDEKDAETPRASWERFQQLSDNDLKKIKEYIIRESGIEEKLTSWFKQYILDEDPEEKIRLPYICPEARKGSLTLDKFISERE